jgi:hypothetical protein
MEDYQAKSPSALVDMPVFVLDHGGKLYTTVSLLEYDPNRRDLTPDQQDAIAKLRQMLQNNPPVPATTAGQTFMATVDFQNAEVNF